MQTIDSMWRRGGAGLWCQPHPHGSFAPVRQNQSVRFFVDGADYFAAVANGLASAKRVIYIAGWWVSPEVQKLQPCGGYRAGRAF